MNNINTVTRDQIQAAYIQWFLDGTTLAELQEIVESDMHEDLIELSDEELITEVTYFAPDLVKQFTNPPNASS